MASQPTHPVILNNASIEWRENTPYSTQFNDIYFSREDGAEETLYTFIEGNRLFERWKQYRSDHSQQPFRIAELGFGTGLNFLSTLYHWHQQTESELSTSPNTNTNEPSATLEFISIEKYPLTHRDLIKAVAQWPHFSGLATPLINHYPLPIKGQYVIEFPELSAKLVLLLMDGEEGLDTIVQQQRLIDAWFLDGFAPSKNPQLWQEKGFQQIASASSEQCTLATFTAAGSVRRGLQSVGFTMEKRPGFGRKREMLIGTLCQKLSDSRQHHTSTKNEPSDSSSARRAMTQTKQQTPPWFTFKTPSKPFNTVAVIGGGIAGCTTARVLAESGMKVTLFESRAHVADGASGNSAGIYYPFLSADMNATSQFYFAAYRQLLHDIDRFQLQDAVNAIGVSRMLSSKEDLDKLTQSLTTNAELNRWFYGSQKDGSPAMGMNEKSETNAIVFPLSGFLSPKLVCQQLILHANIHLQTQTPVTSLKKVANQWQLTAKHQQNNHSIHQTATESFDAVVIANSCDAQSLLPEHFLPAITVRGQTLFIDNHQLQALSIEKPKTVLCDDIYVIPQPEGIYVGATFEHDNPSTKLEESSHQWLTQQLIRLLGRERTFDLPMQGRVGFRYCSVDRLPIVGPLPNLEDNFLHYQTLWQGKRPSQYPESTYHSGLFVNIAHGARGITSSFLSARILQHYMTTCTSFITPRLLEKVHPNRFLIKEMRKPENKRLPFITALAKRIEKKNTTNQ